MIEQDFKPINNRILVRVDSELMKKKGTIIYNDSSQEKPNTGVILQVDKSILDTEFRNGRRIMFSKYSGASMMEDKVEYRIIKKDDVLGFYDVEFIEGEDVNLDELKQDFYKASQNKFNL